jgi:nucleotide-binding universal stress UspA family protein
LKKAHQPGQTIGPAIVSVRQGQGQDAGGRLAISTPSHLIHRPAGATKACISSAIAQEAQQLGADAVVVASHSHGVISEFLLGSVAKSLVDSCPMWVAA